MVVKIGIVKVGNIGTSLVIDLILDERADREDLDVRTISSGAKMEKEQIDDVVSKVYDFDPDLIIFISPNPNATHPKQARDKLYKSHIPTVIIGDKPGEKAIHNITDQGMGYILIRADAMIGARREFLDSTEMALFNADVLKVLSVTGALRLVNSTIDEMIMQIKDEEPVDLPEIIVDAELAVFNAGFRNPYAMAKAIASYKMAELVSEMDIKACFQIDEPDRYIPLVTASHELMSHAAKLADEARELEKANDNILRTPHASDGSIGVKQNLIDNIKY